MSFGVFKKTAMQRYQSGFKTTQQFLKKSVVFTNSEFKWGQYTLDMLITNEQYYWFLITSRRISYCFVLHSKGQPSWPMKTLSLI